MDERDSVWNLMGSNRLSEIDSLFIRSRQLQGGGCIHAHPPPLLQSADAHEPAAAAEDKGEESKGSLGGKFCIMKRSLSHHPALSKKEPHTASPPALLLFAPVTWDVFFRRLEGLRRHFCEHVNSHSGNRAKTTDGQYQVFLFLF